MVKSIMKDVRFKCSKVEDKLWDKGVSTVSLSRSDWAAGMALCKAILYAEHPLMLTNQAVSREVPNL